MAQSRLKLRKKVWFSVVVIASIFVIVFILQKRVVCKDCNVLIIDIDVLRAQDLGFYEHGVNNTPNIDSLAKDSLVFKNAYSQGMLTFPSHISYLTSTYPYCNKALVPERDVLSRKIPTLPQIFQKEGYRTIWVTPFINHQLALSDSVSRGYDKIIRVSEVSDEILNTLLNHNKFLVSFYTVSVHDPYQARPSSILKFDPDVNLSDKRLLFNSSSRTNFYYWQTFLNKSFMSRILTKEEFKKYLDLNTNSNNIDDKMRFVIDFLRNNTADWKKKSYLILTASFPHVREEFWGMFNKSNSYDVRLLRLLYDAAIYEVDKGIGQLLSDLKEWGLYNKTIIVLMSDHGEELFEHGCGGHWNLNDETLHVPLLIKIPGVKPRVINSLVENIDIMPTLLATVGLPIPKTAQGLNLLPFVLHNTEPQLNTAFSEALFRYSVRTKGWRFVSNTDRRYVGCGPLPRYQLFRVVDGDDAPENLVNESPEVAASLNRTLNRWLEMNKNCDYKVISRWKPYLSEGTKERILKTGYW